MKKREFSPDELADILRRRAAGQSIKMISEAYGCSGMVISRALSMADAAAAAGRPVATRPVLQVTISADPEVLAAIRELTAAMEMLTYSLSQHESKREAA